MTVIIESNYRNLWMLFDFFNYQQYVSIQKIGPKTDYIVFMQILIFKFLHSTHLTPSLNHDNVRRVSRLHIICFVYQRAKMVLPKMTSLEHCVSPDGIALLSAKGVN